jgi:hypothetical protein
MILSSVSSSIYLQLWLSTIDCGNCDTRYNGGEKGSLYSHRHGVKEVTTALQNLKSKYELRKHTLYFWLLGSFKDSLKKQPGLILSKGQARIVSKRD